VPDLRAEEPVGDIKAGGPLDVDRQHVGRSTFTFEAEVAVIGTDLEDRTPIRSSGRPNFVSLAGVSSHASGHDAVPNVDATQRHGIDLRLPFLRT
jgi:hypothetical protein